MPDIYTKASGLVRALEQGEARRDALDTRTVCHGGGRRPMTGGPKTPLLEDVLDEFAMEANLVQATLERYLAAYPEYAEELVDLAGELSREHLPFEGDLTEIEQSLVDAAWRKHEAAAPRYVSNPLAHV